MHTEKNSLFTSAQVVTVSITFQPSQHRKHYMQTNQNLKDNVLCIFTCDSESDQSTYIAKDTEKQFVNNFQILRSVSLQIPLHSWMLAQFHSRADTRKRGVWLSTRKYLLMILYHHSWLTNHTCTRIPNTPNNIHAYPSLISSFFLSVANVWLSSGTNLVTFFLSRLSCKISMGFSNKPAAEMTHSA